MGVQATSVRSPRLLFPVTALFIAICLSTTFILFKVDQFVSTTKTVVGHNLDPTPWHPFPPKHLNNQSSYTTASNIIQCSYLTCRGENNIVAPKHNLFNQSSEATTQCPSFFRWIHHDLEPWAESRISMLNLMEAKKSAAFRVVIVGGRLYVDFYYACVQSRAMFTLWGLLQLLRRYPGRIPDVDIMFDCMDKPFVKRSEYGAKTTWPPPPLFSAEGAGKRGQDLMGEMSMDRVYDYMYHLIKEYSKLQNFQPSPPPSAQQVCMESLLCFAEAKQRDFLKRSTVPLSSSLPCNLPPPDSDFINNLIEKKSRIISDIQESEKVMHRG